MKNPTTPLNSYEEAKKQAKEFYMGINKAWCPVLNDHVVFNNSGFDHLVGKGSILRPKSEQKRRFALLPYAESILGDSSAQVEHEERIISHSTKINGERTNITSKAQFWRFYGVRDEKMIKLVIRQIDNHPKHFFSIFEGKRKIAQ